MAETVGVAATTTIHAGVRAADAGCAGAPTANDGGLHVHVALPALRRNGVVLYGISTEGKKSYMNYTL